MSPAPRRRRRRTGEAPVPPAPAPAPTPPPEVPAEPPPLANRAVPASEPVLREPAAARSRAEPHRTGGNDVTVEGLAYLALVLFAAAWRLGNLGGYPLSSPEAGEALAVLNVLKPAAGAAPAASSPMLFTGNLLMMGLLGPNDATARLFVALCGVALVLVPLLYRRWLGRTGALATGLLIALSPTAIAASRTVSSEMPVALFASLALGAALNWMAGLPASLPAGVDGHAGAAPGSGMTPWLVLAAVASGLAVAAGPSVFTVLALAAFAGLAWTWLSGAVRADLRARWAGIRATAGLRRAGLVALAAFVVVATAAFLVPQGLSMAAGMLPAWAGAFAPGTTAGALGGLFNHLLMLFVYEPMLLLFGLAGLAWQWRQAQARNEDDEDNEQEGRWQHWVAPVLAWLAAALLLSLVRPARAPGEVLWITLPLAGLGGALLGEALEGRRAMQMPLLTWGLAATMLIIAIVAGVLVRTYASQSAAARPGDELTLVFFPWMLALTVIIQVLLAAAVVVWDRPSWRGVALAALLPLAVYACSAAYGVANLRATSPAEPWVRHPTSERIYTFLDVLRSVSLEKTGMAVDVPITVEGSRAGVLAWYLRDFEAVTYVDLLAPTTNTEVVITSDRVVSPTLATPYMGARFELNRRWLAPGSDPQRGVRPGEVLGWLLARSGGTYAPEEGIVLWRVAPPPASEPNPVEAPAPAGGGEVNP